MLLIGHFLGAVAAAMVAFGRSGELKIVKSLEMVVLRGIGEMKTAG